MSELEISLDKWRLAYIAALKNPPTTGSVIVTQDGSPIKVEIDLKEGADPFVFARLYLPSRVGGPTQWFARSLVDKECGGWKCVFMVRARMELFRRQAIDSNITSVKSLRVVKNSLKDNSLLVEVAEW